MSQDELTKAIINIINKELGVVKEILPKDLLKNLQNVMIFLKVVIVPFIIIKD